MAYKTHRTTPSLFEQLQEHSSQSTGNEALSVAQLTKAIRATLEPAFSDVVVEGEISNFTHHRSGHRYFTLKDSEAQISAVFWKTRTANFQLKDGLKVVCRGRLTVYPPSGRYQLDVFQIRPVGIGELQRAFEHLYKKLEAEGLFDISRKRPIPQYPRVIGIVTSETGAALHDILTVLRRRYPLVRVVLRPAAVQGIGAELDIARAIQEFNLTSGEGRPDLLIVGRGGGSLEDLWAFNEEAVARAIYASRIPIISAVGHEVDVSIADMVADLRAPTPTAAAELATPDRAELLAILRQTNRVLTQTVQNTMRMHRRELQNIASGYSLNACVLDQIEHRRRNVSDLGHRIATTLDRTLEKFRLTLERDHAKLAALDPHAVLTRGYAIVQTADGSVVTSRDQLQHVNEGTVEFSDGKIKGYWTWLVE